MTTQFGSNTFENDYILAVLDHMVIELKTDRPAEQTLDKYAVELTAFMNGVIRSEVNRTLTRKIPPPTLPGYYWCCEGYTPYCMYVVHVSLQGGHEDHQMTYAEAEEIDADWYGPINTPYQDAMVET